MRKGKLVAVILSVIMLFGVGAALAGCGGGDAESKIFRIVTLEGGRGNTYIYKLRDEFNKHYGEEYKDVQVEVTTLASSVIADEVTNMINSGKKPDLLFMNLSAPKSPVEKFVKDQQLVDVSDVLQMTAPGETAKVGDKLIGNILNNYSCQPYGNGKTYLLPAFYSPHGVFYNAEKYYAGTTAVEGKQALPKTMNEFFAIGETLKNDGDVNTNLFTYPTAGYFDGYLPALLANYGGAEKYKQALNYADGIWEDADIKAALTQIVKLKDYLEPNTTGQANSAGFMKNQQAFIDHKADFMPNGDWVIGEMAATTPKDFEWAFMPVPKKEASGTAYINTFIETMFIHTASDNQDMAKKFMAMYYGASGAKIIAEEAGAIIATNEALANAKANGVQDNVISLYNAYQGASAIVGNFVATKPVADVVWKKIIYDDGLDDIMKSTKTVEELVNEWSAKLEAASDQLRAAIIK